MNGIYFVYVYTDSNSNIVKINSDAFLTNTTEWIKIDEGLGDKYHHAQSNYFDKPIITNSGVYRYRLADGVVVEKPDAEIESEEQPTAEEIELEQRRTEVQQLIDGNMCTLPDDLRRSCRNFSDIWDAIIEIADYVGLE